MILTGFMGTGKSAVGHLLAERLGYRWVDTDDLIESRHGPIPEIFANDGEASFRAMERQVAEELSEQHSLVISTGGRMMLDSGNRQLLGATGRTFCLTATPATIIERLTPKGAAHRPVLLGPDLRERIVELLEERSEGYGQFAQIDTDHKTAQDVAAEIVRVLRAPSETP